MHPHSSQPLLLFEAQTTTLARSVDTSDPCGCCIIPVESMQAITIRSNKMAFVHAIIQKAIIMQQESLTTIRATCRAHVKTKSHTIWGGLGFRVQIPQAGRDGISPVNLQQISCDVFGAPDEPKIQGPKEELTKKFHVANALSCNRVPGCCGLIALCTGADGACD